jgi:hypothetical protein
MRKSRIAISILAGVTVVVATSVGSTVLVIHFQHTGHAEAATDAAQASATPSGTPAESRPPAKKTSASPRETQQPVEVPTQKTFLVSGTAVIPGNPIQPCSQTFDAGAILKGATVAILDENGVAVASGTLGKPWSAVSVNNGGPTCAFPFTVHQVPENAEDLYEVQIIYTGYPSPTIVKFEKENADPLTITYN